MPQMNREKSTISCHLEEKSYFRIFIEVNKLIFFTKLPNGTLNPLILRVFQDVV